jgi:GT2 family glycosyltransferase
MNIQEKSRCRTVFTIVTWNRKKMLNQCLHSLKKYVPCLHKIVVVDNASSDGTSDLVRKEHPDVMLIENKKNEGFGKANNRGLDYLVRRSIPFDYVVFLNDDVRLYDGSLQALILYMDDHPEVKACLPGVFMDHGKLQTGVAGYGLSLKSAFYYFSFLSILFPRFFKGFFIHQHYFRKRGIILEVDWISGVCMVLRGCVARSLRFSEDFFMYAEDLALCAEIKKFGKIVYFPHAGIVHRNKIHAPQTPPRWIESLFRYYKMENGKGAAEKLWLLKIIFVCGFLLRCFGYSILNIVSGSENAQKRRELLSYSKNILKNFFG